MDRTSKVAAGANGRPKRNGSSRRQFEELWFTLARRRWNSVVLVPTDPGGSAASIGKSLAEVGTRLSEIPVTAVAVSTLEYASALALVDLQEYANRERRGRVERVPTINVTGAEVHGVAAAAGGASAPRAVATPSDALAPLPTARLIIAIPAVVSEPLGLAAAQSADAIVLTIELGRTRLQDARRTIELVGRDRIAGCFLVR